MELFFLTCFHFPNVSRPRSKALKKKLQLLASDVRDSRAPGTSVLNVILMGTPGLGAVRLGGGGLSLTALLFLGNPRMSRWQGVQRQHGFGALCNAWGPATWAQPLPSGTLTRPVRHLQVSYLGRKGRERGHGNEQAPSTCQGWNIEFISTLNRTHASTGMRRRPPRSIGNVCPGRGESQEPEGSHRGSHV